MTDDSIQSLIDCCIALQVDEKDVLARLIPPMMDRYEKLLFVLVASHYSIIHSTMQSGLRRKTIF